MLITKILYNALIESFNESVKRKLLNDLPISNFVVEKPNNPSHGDYASNLPLQLAKLQMKNPLEIAEILQKTMKKSELFEKVSIAPPGFLNFTLHSRWALNQLSEILKFSDKYGYNNSSEGKKIQVEFVSVNPTGRLHLGHIRGAIIGSTLSNILETQNHKVTREYYVNDGGNQIYNFAVSLRERIKELCGLKFSIPEHGYHGEDIKEIAKCIIDQNINISRDASEIPSIEELTKLGIDICIKNIKTDLKSLNVEHDSWFYESTLFESNYLNETMEKLNKTETLYEKDGALWIKTSLMGDERDNVLKKSSDQTFTYLATDIAYHRDKLEKRNFDTAINIWGADHYGHINRLKLALEKLDIKPDRLKIILNQIVSLKDSSRIKRLSKRLGNTIYIKEVVKDIGADACRFSFLNRSAESQMEIDLDLLKKQSSDNPVFYVQYAHARISSILRECSKKGIDEENANLGLIDSETEMNLIKKLVDYPELLNRISKSMNTHELPAFSFELAQLLQKFYENCRVLDEKNPNKELTKSRLLLVKATKITLSNILKIMGMNAPEKM